MKKSFVLFAAMIAALLIPGTMQAQQQTEKIKLKAESSEGNKSNTPLVGYNRLFQGKSVTSAKNGIMTIHSVRERGKQSVYLEFPLALLGRDLMLTSVIEQTSDAGEGVVGQFSNFITLRFTREKNNTLSARILVGNEPVNRSEEKNIGEILSLSNHPGIWQTMPIMAFTPDSSAVVIDMSRILLDHNDYTSPFSAFGGNSMGGFTSRTHKPRPEMTEVKSVVSTPTSIKVGMEMGFSVDHVMMGTQVYRRDVPVNIAITRILKVLPAEKMITRPADIRVGARMILQNGIDSPDHGFKNNSYVMRWNLIPSDMQAYRNGQKVEPVKPLVYYVDTLMPAMWKRAIKDGFESWNKAFEEAGFKNAIRVVDFPRNDASFSGSDLDYCVIRYSPLWLTFSQSSVHFDLKTGELLNTSFVVHSGLMQALENNYKAMMMATDPRTRTSGSLPEDLSYELLRNYMVQVAGSSLGLTFNAKVHGTYAVDSLRSATFTRKNGLTPSIMHNPFYNYIARESDIKNGALLMMLEPGEYDRFAIKWLYTYVPDAKNSQQLAEALEPILTAQSKNPNCRFGYESSKLLDPSMLPGILGSDHLKSMDYYLKNARAIYANIDQWLNQGDPDYEIRNSLLQILNGDIDLKSRFMMAHLGGFTTSCDEKGWKYDFGSREDQKKYLDFIFSLMADARSYKSHSLETKMAIDPDPTQMFEWSLFSRLLQRVEYYAFASEKSTSTYTPEQFIDQLMQRTWQSVYAHRAPNGMERSMQQVMVGVLLNSSGVLAVPRQGGQPQQAMVRESGGPQPSKVTAVEHTNGLFIPPIESIQVTREPVRHLYYGWLMKTRRMLRQAVAESSGDTKLHYRYMLWKIDGVLNDN